MINVTKTYLPDKSRYIEYVNRIFETGWLTNNGQLVRELEKRLADYLGVENLLVVTNGTLALQIAFRALGIKGKVITTPFTFVATVSSLVWEGLNPVFADIDNETFNISPELIERKISKETSAILPVHVFGNVCEVEQIETIARRYNLKLIFDAAHAFGVRYNNSSILNFGDASILSFHSTKIFHTIEGGAIVFSDRKDYDKARLMINFGIAGYDRVDGLGINGKMNEFQAAMGLCVLEDIEELIVKRKVVYKNYINAFSGKKDFILQKLNTNATHNYSYFPLVFRSERIRENVLRLLQESDIFPRKYFSPSLETLDYLNYTEEMPVSQQVSHRILCLPLYESLTKKEQKKIIEIVLSGISDD
jgi:dTDP-4-amino-4,6-dideoxygalactose transaminase